jgi:hypothetical protein
MGDFFKAVGGFLAFILVLLVLTWVIQGNEFFMYQYFAPRQAAVERRVFEETKSYNQGMIQELQNMQFQYVQAKPEQQAILASIILHRTADYDISKLPPDLRSFVLSLRIERTH